MTPENSLERRAAGRAARSSFVTVVAWIFIALAGFATLVALLQNVMLNLVFPAEMTFPAVDPRTGKEMPAILLFLFAHFRLLFAAFLAVSGTTLVAAIGLLLRREWARVLFIAMMAVGIAWNVGAFLVTIPMFSSFADVAAGPHPPPSAHAFDVMWKVMMGVNALFVAGFVWLCAWIIKRLTSSQVCAEFATP